jgi:FKBP-type peptidyl-prolyl cis-trans isomerase FkpA
MEVNRLLVKKDSARIAEYIKNRNWDMIETKTGLWYKIYEKGTGKKSKEGLYATINYNVELLDGTQCYSSDSLGPKRFKIGRGSVESGLEEGILLLKEGDKARFILPPHLAHGLVGDDNRIPARSIIVYDVELLSLDN